MPGDSAEHLLNHLDFILGDVQDRDAVIRVEMAGDLMIGRQGADLRQRFDADLAD